MLQAVKSGVFVAVDAYCILPLLASVLHAASAIIWREFLTKTRQTGAAERLATLGVAQSTDALPRITAAREIAARHDAAELKPAPAPLEATRTPTQRATEKRMTFTTAALGSLSGLFIGVFSNGVRKLPLFRRPWDHLILMGIMGYGGHKYPQLEDATLERVNAMRAARKLGPLDKNVWGLAVSKQEASQNKD